MPKDSWKGKSRDWTVKLTIISFFIKLLCSINLQFWLQIPTYCSIWWIPIYFCTHQHQLLSCFLFLKRRKKKLSWDVNEFMINFSSELVSFCLESIYEDQNMIFFCILNSVWMKLGLWFFCACLCGGMHYFYNIFYV